MGGMHSHSNILAADERFRNLYEDVSALSGVGAWACDLRTEALSWTPVVYDIFGLPQDKRVDRRETFAMYAEPFRLMLDRVRSTAIANCGSFSLEAQIFRADGEERWIRLKAATKVQSGHAVRLYGMKEDITIERKRWEQLRRSAEYDALTGLANRAQFHVRFLDRAPGSEALALSAFVLFDLDNLREINRQWGIAAGDACLAVFARRLLAAYPVGALATRLGGSEFAILLNNSVPVGMLGAHSQLNGLAEPVPWGAGVIPIRVSAGIVFPRRYCSFEAEALYAQATLVLEVAKMKEEEPLRVVAVGFDESKYGLTDQGSRRNSENFQLSPRETEVLRHIGQGSTTDEIAEMMGVSRHTVRNFIRRIYQKMEVSGRVEAVRLAGQHGML